MKSELDVYRMLDELMSSEIGKCGDCPKIRECWALENLSLGKKPGHIEHSRPLFDFDFICNREIESGE